jgi:hypothetical protein
LSKNLEEVLKLYHARLLFAAVLADEFVLICSSAANVFKMWGNSMNSTFSCVRRGPLASLLVAALVFQTVMTGCLVRPLNSSVKSDFIAESKQRALENESQGFFGPIKKPDAGSSSLSCPAQPDPVPRLLARLRTEWRKARWAALVAGCISAPFLLAHSVSRDSYDFQSGGHATRAERIQLLQREADVMRKKIFEHESGKSRMDLNMVSMMKTSLEVQYSDSNIPKLADQQLLDKESIPRGMGVVVGFFATQMIWLLSFTPAGDKFWSGNFFRKRRGTNSNSTRELIARVSNQLAQSRLKASETLDDAALNEKVIEDMSVLLTELDLDYWGIPVSTGEVLRDTSGTAEQKMLVVPSYIDARASVSSSEQVKDIDRNWPGEVPKVEFNLRYELATDKVTGEIVLQPPSNLGGGPEVLFRGVVEGGAAVDKANLASIDMRSAELRAMTKSTGSLEFSQTVMSQMSNHIDKLLVNMSLFRSQERRRAGLEADGLDLEAAAKALPPGEPLRVAFLPSGELRIVEMEPLFRQQPK